MAKATAHSTASPLPIPDIPVDAAVALVRLRREAMDEIDRLLGFLDATDVDSDLEDDNEDNEAGVDDEPDLGAPDGIANQARSWAIDSPWSEPEHDNFDLEPSLGSLGSCGSIGYAWAGGGTLDLEVDEGDTGIGDAGGLGEQTIDEGALGSFDRMLNQEKSYHVRQPRNAWGTFSGDDRELDDADREDDDPAEDDGNREEHEPSGIADFEGYAEQAGFYVNGYTVV